MGNTNLKAENLNVDNFQGKPLSNCWKLKAFEHFEELLHGLQYREVLPMS